MSLTASGSPPHHSYPSRLELRNRVEGSEEDLMFKERELMIGPCISSDGPDKRFSVELSASNASETTFQLVSSWLQPYRDEQQKFSLDRRRAPKRLVDIGLTDQSQIRIIYPQDQSLYLTVSHCWGERETHGITLNDDTLKDFMEGYEYSRLPRLLRDCVHVTRRLGIRYVWIDSLCIRQDNDEDKMEEINKMGDIYAGSFCNILAVSAKDGRSSLFTKRLPLGNRVHNTWWEMRPLATQYTDYVPSEPLYKRAWVLQERLLAPRAIAYTHEGVTWEHNADNITKLYHESALTRAWNSLLEMKSTVLPEELKIDGQGMWMEVVHQYSRSNITDDKDRERALLGIISVVQGRTGLSIVCGVCENFLPYSLLWTTAFCSQKLKNPGPSWSRTFRSIPSYQQTWIWKYKTVRLQCRNFSIDEGTLVLSVTGWSNSSLAIRFVSTDSGPAVFQSLTPASDDDDDFRLYADNEDWCKFDMRLDYKDFDTTEVDLLVLIEEEDNKLAVGLILSKDHVNVDSWTRLGMFVCRDYSSLSKFFQVEKTYQIS